MWKGQTHPYVVPYIGPCRKRVHVWHHPNRSYGGPPSEIYYVEAQEETNSGIICGCHEIKISVLNVE